jgi:hypothetical protein
MDAPVKKPQRGLKLTPEEYDLLDRLRATGADGTEAAELILWWESEAVGLLRTNDRLYNKISGLETRLATNIAAYPERFYAEMNVDNWHLLMRAAGVRVKKGATPRGMRENFDLLAHSERVEAFENYLSGADHEGRPMLSNVMSPTKRRVNGICDSRIIWRSRLECCILTQYIQPTLQSCRILLSRFFHPIRLVYWIGSVPVCGLGITESAPKPHMWAGLNALSCFMASIIRRGWPRPKSRPF